MFLIIYTFHKNSIFNTLCYKEGISAVKKISEQPLPTVQMQTQHDAPDVTEGALQVESSSHYITTTRQGVSGSRLQINAHVPFFGY